VLQSVPRHPCNLQETKTKEANTRTLHIGLHSQHLQHTIPAQLQCLTNTLPCEGHCHRRVSTATTTAQTHRTHPTCTPNSDRSTLCTTASLPAMSTTPRTSCFRSAPPLVYSSTSAVARCSPRASSPAAAHRRAATGARSAQRHAFCMHKELAVRPRWHPAGL
jgi:hypothetical protein